MKQNPLKVLNLIAQTIYDKKGFNVLALDVRNFSTLTDYFIIAEGNVDKHVCAIAHAIIDQLKEYGEKPIHTEGLQQGDWIVLDYLEVVIHLFQPGLREKYQLEELWREAAIVDVEIILTPELTTHFTQK